MVQIARAISTWNVIQGLWESSELTGQYGNDDDSVMAVQPIAPASRIWQTPSAVRGRMVRETREPIPLPMPIPTRKMARMMENV